VPKVSIIIPTFNRANFIAQAIDSVLAQTYDDFEVIVVDDGSSDMTPEILVGYVDDRLVHLTQNNRGRSSARNRALTIARGEYIAFLDSDDTYLPDKLALQVSFLDNHPDVGMVYTSAACIDEEGRGIDYRYIASMSGLIYRYIAFFEPITITLPTVMARRSVFEKVGVFDESMDRFEDTDMWRRISKITYIQAMPIETCKLRTHHGNRLASQSPASILKAIAYYCRKIRKEDTDQPILVRQKGIAQLYLYYGKAFKTVPGWENSGRMLAAKAYLNWPPFFFHDVWNAKWRHLALLLRLPYLLCRKILRSVVQ
jgi:glycosyltransferase involved in cell wall biosynthesis